MKRWFSLFLDVLLVLLASYLLYGFWQYIQHGLAEFQRASYINLSLRFLPKYALFSLVRSFIALFFSYTFAIVLGTLASRSRTSEIVLIPIVDILQSLPVLTFVPGFLIVLTKMFPHSRWGIELSCILLIFVGQVWNLVFAYYESRKTLPKTYHELAALYQFSPLQKFLKLQLPYGLKSLIFNGMMSMAGGWVFLTTCESFVLKNRAFQVLGLGSYLAVTFSEEKYFEFVWGILALIVIITGVNFFLWKPLQAWVDGIYDTDSSKRTKSFFYEHLKTSLVAKKFSQIFHFFGNLVQGLVFYINRLKGRYQKTLPFWKKYRNRMKKKKILVLKEVFKSVLIFLFALVVFKSLPLLPKVSTALLFITQDEWLLLSEQILKTLGRVFTSLVIGSLWALPIGILIGKNAFLRSLVTPIIQNLAAFPMPALFPLIAMALVKNHIPSGLIAIGLMTVANQWYILFNVISGSSQIPKKYDVVSKLYLKNRFQNFFLFYLPAILPSLITGLMGASGAAWNISILAEYVEFPPEKILITDGIGGQITKATATGDYPILIASIVLISFVLIFINQLVWRPLIRLTERSIKS
jgi:NitT/TauT family transport system permease protein